jgi:hypothetical protein
MRGDQIRHLPGQLDLPAGQHDQVVGHPFQLGHHVRGQHYGDALFGHRRHHGLHELVPGQRVERGERQVEQGGLACSVRSHEGDHVPGRDAQRAVP